MYKIEKYHWWFVGRRNIIYMFLVNFLPNKINNAIDIGCGTGLNTSLLKSFSNNVAALESSDVAINFVKKSNPELSIIKGKFPDFYSNEKYDLITLFDVLEHIKDDSYSLKRIEELLNPGGVALITIPALPLLWTEHDELFGHYRRYKKGELENLITSNTKLSITKISYFNFFLFPPILLIRLIKKIYNFRKGESDFYNSSKPINYLFSKIFSLEGFFIKYVNLPIGSSIICVLRKDE